MPLSTPDLSITYVPTDRLRPAEYNPRTWDTEAERQLKESISRFGIVDPLLVNSAPEREGIVIGGHFRLAMLKELGIETVPVVHIDIPDLEREKELNIRLNKNIGAFDWSLLSPARICNNSRLLGIGIRGNPRFRESLRSVFIASTQV